MTPQTKPRTGADYDAFRTLIETRSGVYFSDARTHHLTNALDRRMQAVRAASFAEYYRLVTSTQQSGEWLALLETVTNHDTRFYRHAATFEALRKHLLPEIAKRSVDGREVPVSIWCAGCSTGEEAYTVAMICLEAAREYPRLACSILGSDLSASALLTAGSGLYGPRSVDQLPESLRAYLREHRSPLGTRYQVRAEVQALVSFQPVNLIDRATYPASSFDLILCQNVFVYFRAEARQQVLNSLAVRLAPGGYLLPGPGEIAGVPCASLRCVNFGEMQAFVKQPDVAQERPA